MSDGPTIDAATLDAIRIGADDPRYLEVVDKQFNKRFRAQPDYVRPVHSTARAISAVQDAVSERRRLVVTSGGHCLEGFVSDPDVRVLIDISPMKRIYYDADRGAIAIEAGATVGETFKARQLGLAAHYLYAVEVVTVDESGRASSVIATRESTDPSRELWWAHALSVR